ncbi:hypothetical protein [Rhodoflexus caldus]|uniref:hypothetical protein n=1 Tax=Rhodoflexus caldus TaxID=2891236 RepID=UPI002029BA20|nr:hypothetical protein [Rhodoflexus caldus]
MKQSILTLAVAALLLTTACGKKQAETAAETMDTETVASTADAVVQESEATSETSDEGKQYTAFVAEVRAKAKKVADLKTLLSNYGDYQGIETPYRETPETFIQPTTEEGAVNEAHIHGYAVVNDFTFVLGSILGLRGQQFTHLLVFDKNNKEVVGEFMVGGGTSDGMNTYTTDAAVASDNVITITETVSKVDDDGNAKDEATSKKRYRFDFSQKKFVEVK